MCPQAECDGALASAPCPPVLLMYQDCSCTTEELMALPPMPFDATNPNAEALVRQIVAEV